MCINTGIGQKSNKMYLFTGTCKKKKNNNFDAKCQTSCDIM